MKPFGGDPSVAVPSILSFPGHIVTSIVVKVNATLLERSGDWLTVSWEGVTHPSDSDWIGVYSPPINGGIDPTNHAPIKYQVSWSVRNTLVSTIASHKFQSSMHKINAPRAWPGNEAASIRKLRHFPSTLLKALAKCIL